jgi:hypothetical protein
MKKLLLFLCLAGIFLTACQLTAQNPDKVADLEFTVVDEREMPQEIADYIATKQTEPMRNTYTTEDYLYVIVSYGEQPTSGYSIAVNDFYLGENAIYVDTSLIGPSKDEMVNETVTYPYIVLKTEKRDEPVVFQ